MKMGIISSPAASIILLLASGCATVPPAESPIVGRWTWTRASNKCTEIYDFRGDGTYRSSSGAERSEGTYVLVPALDANSPAKLSISGRAVQVGKDCDNAVADGAVHTGSVYLRFGPSGEEYRMCYDAEGRQCFGPLRRVDDAWVLDRAVTSGVAQYVSYWYSINPDCTSRGALLLRIVHAPEHGKITVEEGMEMAGYNQGLIRYGCSAQRVPATRVYYRSDSGYVGTDLAVIEILYPDGDVRTARHRLAIWPSEPERIAGAEPEYPPELSDRRVVGKVSALLTIDSEGRVANVTISQSSMEEFSEAVKRAAFRWKFRPPAMRHTSEVVVRSYDFILVPP